jgi:hypothetical protein
MVSQVRTLQRRGQPWDCQWCQEANAGFAPRNDPATATVADFSDAMIEIGGIMSEIAAYGTAVTVEPCRRASPRSAGDGQARAPFCDPTTESGAPQRASVRTNEAEARRRLGVAEGTPSVDTSAQPPGSVVALARALTGQLMVVSGGVLQAAGPDRRRATLRDS